MAAPYPIDYSHKSGFAMPNVGHESDTFTQPLFKIGTSSLKVHVKTASIPVMQMYITSARTSGTIDLFKIDFTQTVAATAGYIKGIRCTMNSNVKTPGSFNAIKGIIDYKTAGYPNGDCAPLASELTIMDGVVIRGAHYLLDAQVSLGTSTTNFASTGPYAFIRCGLNGTKAQWDSYGGLFNITGFTEGDDLFLDNNGSPSEADGGIRFFINGAVRYLLYANDAET